MNMIPMNTVMMNMEVIIESTNHPPYTYGCSTYSNLFLSVWIYKIFKQITIAIA